MYELPLFPLNTVLFPGMPIKLHIFEERYKLMMNQCIENETPFGVVLIAEGVEALGPLAEPHMIGCTARITQVSPLGDGRMNILAVGQERFEIQELRHDQPYLVAMVEPFPFNDVDPTMLENSSSQLRRWVERYLRILAQAGDVEFDAEQLPDDPLTLAHLAAIVLQVPMNQKQELLSMSESNKLLTTMRSLYRREVAILEAMLSHSTTEEGPFSLN
jgi:uncharacterized protein